MISIINNNKINLLPQYSVNKNTENKINSLNTNYSDQNLSKVPVESLKAYTLAFSAKKQTPVDKPVDLTNINWDEINWDKLKEKPVDWKTATKKDVLNFWQKLALCEVKESTWVNRYNPDTRYLMLSTGHAIASSEAKEKHDSDLKSLQAYCADSLGQIQRKFKKSGHPDYLDKPLIDPKTGKFSVDFTVFDTETTGVGDDDKILQIGAAQFKNGVRQGNGYNQLFDPEIEVNPRAAEVHGYTNEKLKELGAKPLKGAPLKDFTQNVIGNNLLIAYNSQFDLKKLNYEIDLHNKDNSKLEKKEQCLTLDPFLMIQRIHPFVGVRKKLGEQYKFLFCKDMEGQAHDALVDVNATVDVLKYCAFYLNKHFTPPQDNPNKKALTVGDFLTFQFGGKVEGLNIELNKEFKVNANKNYAASYMPTRINADNYTDGLVMNQANYDNFKKHYSDELGAENMAKLKTLLEDEIMVKKVKKIENQKLRVAKGGKSPKKFEPGYSQTNFTTILIGEIDDSFKISDYKGTSAKKLIELICDNSPNLQSDFEKSTWLKNLDTRNKENDLPDIEVSRQVMLDNIQDETKKPVRKSKKA